MADATLPNWQPISMLPVIVELIDGELADAEEHHGTLQQALGRPHVFDDATVQRSIKLHTEQLEFLWVFREQLDRWRGAGPAPREREEIARLSLQLGRLHTLLTTILALAGELKEGTIEKVLAKSDLELGVEVLQL
jgi:hypothetical protein